MWSVSLTTRQSLLPAALWCAGCASALFFARFVAQPPELKEMFIAEGRVERVTRVSRKGFSGRALDIVNANQEPLRLCVNAEHLRNCAASAISEMRGQFVTARVARENERLWI